MLRHASIVYRRARDYARICAHAGAQMCPVCYEHACTSVCALAGDATARLSHTVGLIHVSGRKFGPEPGNPLDWKVGCGWCRLRTCMLTRAYLIHASRSGARGLLGQRRTRQRLYVRVRVGPSLGGA